MYFFAYAMRCFFIRSVKSGFLAALRLGKPKPFCRRCCMVRTATFFSSSECKFFSSRAVSRGFFAPPFLLKCPSRLMFFFFVHLQICACGLYWGEALWLRLKDSLLLTLALPLRAHISFVETFSCLQARILTFFSLLVYFPGILKTLISNIL